MYPMYRLKENPTDGTEYARDENEKEEIIKAETRVAHTKCDYCGKEVLGVWDIYNERKWWPYLGHSSKRVNAFAYSPIIQAMKHYDGCDDKVWNNNLLNVHAVVHSKDWGLRCMDGSIKILCNECFQKTYNRYQIELEDDNGNPIGKQIAISVVEDRGETPESVLKSLGLHGKILGKGGKF